MTFNPYQPPESPIISGPVSRTRDEVRSSLRVPAIGLLVLASLSMTLDAFIVVHGIVDDPPKIARDAGPEIGRLMSIANVVANGGLLFIHGFVFYGSLMMLGLRSHSTALMAAVVSLIPFCSPLVMLGVPFALWAVLTLRRAGSRKAFS